MSKKNKDMDRNLIYNRNEKRVNDTYAKHNRSESHEDSAKLVAEAEHKEESSRNNKDGEDSTKYGEFVSSFHHWLPIEEQKDTAKKLDDMTKD